MGGAYLGKRRCKDPTTPVQSGTNVSAYWRWPLTMEPIPFGKDWIVANHGQLLIANKPQGLPTQGRRDADYMAFYELLKKHLNGYLGLHHRLDQNTSGLMLFSRNPGINSTISNGFQKRLFEKRYLAICGPWPLRDQALLVDAPLAPKNFRTGTKQEVSPSGKSAQTHFRLLAQTETLSLVEAKPITGRTHQIRAHLSHLGVPLLGDRLYGGAHTQHTFMLHCWKLSWPKQGLLKEGSFHLLPPTWWTPHLPESLLPANVLLADDPC